MSPLIATAFFFALILGLFWLDRDREVRTSKALWISVVWIAIACSRPVSLWFHTQSAVDPAQQVLDGSPVDRLVYAALLVGGIMVEVRRRKQFARLLRANGPILFFFLYCVVSFLWSDYPGVAFKRWTKAVGDLVMVWLVLTERQPLAAIKRALARLTFVLIPLSILFIKYYPEIGVGYGPWGGSPNYCGVTTHKSTLGVICLVFGLASLWRLVDAYKSHVGTRRPRQLIAHSVVLVMVFWLFRTIDSMTSMTCFVMAGTLLLAANIRMVARRRALVHLSVVFSVAASAAVVFFNASPDTLKALGRDPTLTDRTEVWGLLLSLVRNPLLGTGFESFWLGERIQKIWTAYWWHPNQAHNGYLEVYLSLGWIGVTLLVVVLIAGYLNIIKGWRRNESTTGLMLAYFLVGIVYNFTEAAFFRMQAPAWIFLLFAITAHPSISGCFVRPSIQRVLQYPGPPNPDLDESTSHWVET